MDRDLLTGVPPSRHPFQFWLFGAAVLNGLFILLAIGEPPSMVSLLPGYALSIWGIVLLVVGTLGLIAGFWKDRITGLLLERIALAGLSGAMFIYASAIFAVTGKAGVAAATFMVSVGLAGIWRISHVGRELKILDRWKTHEARVKQVRKEHLRILEKGFEDESTGD